MAKLYLSVRADLSDHPPDPDQDSEVSTDGVGGSVLRSGVGQWQGPVRCQSLPSLPEIYLFYYSGKGIELLESLYSTSMELKAKIEA
jgi:hypothetical protein